MAQVIGTNVASLNAQRNLNTSQAALQTSLQRLSSGMRINSAKDDAAGLAISQRFTSQINGLDQAARNSNDAISLAQTAEGSLSSTTDALQRIRQLAVQSANVTNSTSDRVAINTEVASLKAEIDRVGNNATFNGVKLLDGSNPTFTFQVGANTTGNDSISISGLPTATLAGLSTISANGYKVVASAVSTASTPVVQDATNFISVNGTKIGNVASGGTAFAQAAAVASAVNAVTGTTGVTASYDTAGHVSFTSTAATGAFTVTALGSGATAIGGQTTLTGAALQTYTATQAASTVFTGLVSDNGTTNYMTINGVQIGNIATASNAAGFGANIATAVNLQSSLTGVSATSDATTGAVTYSGTGLNSAGAITIVTAGTYAAAGAVPSAVSATLSSVQSTGLTNLDVLTAAGASLAIQQVDSALGQVALARATLGAAQNRFASVVTNLQTTSENLSASRSRIQDTDFAAETAALTKNQILQQAGTAMLAQANSLPNSVLTLLKG